MRSRRASRCSPSIPKLYPAQVAAAQADLARAQAQKAQADREKARLMPLAERKAIGQKEADDAASNAELAAAAVQSAQAKLDELKLNLGYTRVVAPISRAVQPRAEVRGQPRHCQRHAADRHLADRSDLGRLQHLRKRAAAPHARGRVRGSWCCRRTTATTSPIKLSDGSTFPRRGRINFADTRVNPTTGTYEMRAEVANADLALKPGQFVRVVLRGAQRKNALAVPQVAVLDGPQGKFVYVVGKDKDGKDIATQRPWSSATGSTPTAPTSGRSSPASRPATSSSSTASRGCSPAGRSRSARRRRAAPRRARITGRRTRFGARPRASQEISARTPMFSRFFIDRPIFAIVISTFLILAGLAAMRSLPIAQYPEIAPPVVTVQAVYPGASATTLEQTVASPIENAINGVPGMIYMSSSSQSNGTVQIQVTFEIGTNVDIAAVNVNNRVKQVEPRLPEEVRRQGVTVERGSSAFLQVLAFYAPDGRYDDLFTSNYVTLNVLDQLKRLPGTTNVQIFGAKDYAMRIWLKPDRLAQLKLTPADVIAAVNEQNAQFAAGKIGQSPIAQKQDLVYTDHHARTPDRCQAVRPDHRARQRRRLDRAAGRRRARRTRLARLRVHGPLQRQAGDAGRHLPRARRQRARSRARP